ncbi:MAG: hypothetical protein NZM04_02815 [Methylacidiphilales bacterium]|nr:hypothetical protein [Candidatus Methylacidiphilales bacterium]MDW8348664.1 hypothetical protein [Verrucomicrobiae bacterium]
MSYIKLYVVAILASVTIPSTLAQSLPIHHLAGAKLTHGPSKIILHPSTNKTLFQYANTFTIFQALPHTELSIFIPQHAKPKLKQPNDVLNIKVLKGTLFINYEPEEITAPFSLRLINAKGTYTLTPDKHGRYILTETGLTKIITGSSNKSIMPLFEPHYQALKKIYLACH